MAGVNKATSSVRKFMWSGALHRARTKVAWAQCCMSKDKGGINMVNPEDALVALMSKWIIKACEPGGSNLHKLLRFRFTHFQLYPKGRWAPSLECFTLAKFQANQGSKVWMRVGKAWRKLCPEVRHVTPRNIEEVGCEPFW